MPGLKPISEGGWHSKWRGGRIKVRGYWKVLVPERAHLSGARRYEWEHRVVAEAKLGRKLLPAEHVHHINGIKCDNRPENLEVYPNSAHHHHYGHGEPGRWRAPGEENRLVPCACGCGGELLEFRKDGYRRRYLLGHHLRGKKRQGLRGKILSA